MFILYETTCLVNGTKYIGVHHREDDGYLGSGNLIKRAIKRYGKDCFDRKILYTFDNGDDAYLKESEIVTPEIVESDLYYNLTIGGRGSHLTGIKNTKDFTKYSEASKKRWESEEYREATCQKMKDNWKRTPERLNRLRTQNIGRELSQQHINALREGHKKTQHIFTITNPQNDVLGDFTIKEICAIMNWNVPSVKQCIWKRSKYKGYNFISHQCA